MVVSLAVGSPAPTADPRKESTRYRWSLQCVAIFLMRASPRPGMPISPSPSSRPCALSSKPALVLTVPEEDHMATRLDNARTIRAPRGPKISARSWLTEAPLRMLMNNLDPEVAEKPQELIVYGGTGRAARNWECFHAIVRSLRELAADETLLVQSGKPVGIFRTHEYAPRVLLCNSNLVGQWDNWDKFHELDRAGLTMYGQMTAGSWIYIGTQGILQGTYETFAAAAKKHFGGS